MLFMGLLQIRTFIILLTPLSPLLNVGTLRDFYRHRLGKGTVNLKIKNLNRRQRAFLSDQKRIAIQDMDSGTIFKLCPDYGVKSREREGK